MIIKKNNRLSGDPKPILYDYFYTETLKPKPVVIFCHGYKGFKDWGAWNHVAKAFADAGFFFVKFNFSHNGGTMQQPIDFPDLEAFAQNSYTQELDDVDRVITHLCNTEEHHQEADINNISIIGHSRGGGIVLIKTGEDTRVKKVITWAGVSDYKSRFKIGSDQFNTWKTTGRFYVTNGRTKQEMPHDWQFFEDFIANEKRLTIKRAVEGLKKPLLIIHGTEDPTVSINEAKNLHSWNANSSVHFIKNANHVFGASHPWKKERLPQELKEVVVETIGFIKK